jgi:phage-related protein
VAEQAYAYVTLIPVAKGFQQAVAKEMGGVGKVGEQAGTEAGKGVSKGFGKAVLGVAGLIAGAFSIRAITNFTKESILAAEAVSTANARLSAVATATGVFGAETDKVTGRLQEFAKAQEMRIAVDDTVIKGVQAQLLSFKQLSGSADEAGGAFDRATLAAFNMAAAGFGSAEGNATALGKALEDPTKGVAALARTGTVFTDQQKDQIRTLQESGDLLGAQEIILAELEGQYGGVAEATADASVKMGLAFDNVKETVGAVLLPIFADLVTDLLPVIELLGGVLAEVFTDLSPIISDLAGQLPGLIESFLPMLPVIGELAGIFLNLVEQFLPIFVDLILSLMPAFTELVPIVADFIAEALDLLVPILLELVDAMVPIVQALLPVMMEIIIALAPVVIKLIEAFLPLVLMVLPLLIGLIEFLAPIFIGMAEIIGVIIVGAIGFLVNAIAWVTENLDTFGKFFEELWTGIKTFFGTIINGLISGFEGFVNGAVKGINRVIDAINALSFTVPDWIPGIGGQKFSFNLRKVAEIALPRVELANGGFVNRPTNALIGEAGPEVVMPLDRFEKMMGIGSGGQGKTVNYYAAPNQSLSSEQELLKAMRRARLVANW